ncbi:MAG: hypothetical protein V4580_13680 [Bacteroidota bacterium]
MNQPKAINPAPVKPITPKSDKHLVKYQYIYLPLLIGVFFLIFKKINFNLFPDYFGLSETKEPEKIAETIISVISSVLGISLAIIILAFEIFRNRLGRIGTSRLLTNQNVIFIVTIQTSVLLYSFLFLLVMGEDIDNMELTILYFLAFVFILSIISLFVLGKKILFETESKKYIQNECNKITPPNVAAIIGYNHGMVDFEKELDNIDSSPFIILRDLGEKYAGDNSHHVSAFIIHESTSKFIPFINSEFDRRALSEFYKALFIIWNGVVNEAINKNGYQSLKQIFNSFLAIHNHHANNGIGLIRTESLEDYMKDFIGKLLAHNQDDVIIDGFMMIENIFEIHIIKSTPKESELKSLSFLDGDDDSKIKHNVDLELQWDFIIEHIPRLLELACKKSIEFRKERVLSYAFTSIQSLIRTISSSNLGKLQKEWVIVNLYLNISHLIKKAFDEGVIDSYTAMSAFEISIFNEVINHKPKYSERLFYFLCDHIKYLVENDRNKLNYSFISFRPTFAPFRKLFQIHEKGDALTETVEKVLNFFTILKEHFEKDINNNYNNYLSLLEEFKSIREYHQKSEILEKFNYKDKEKEKISEELLAKIDKIITGFQKIKAASKKVQKDDNWWDNITLKS